METNCQKCGDTKMLAERRGIFLCSPCMTAWILTGLQPVIRNDDQLPDDVAAQNIAEAAKYE